VLSTNFYLVLIATTCTQRFLEDFTPEFQLLCPLFSSIMLASLFCLSWSLIMTARSRKFLLFFFCVLKLALVLLDFLQRERFADHA
jgi:hypothetical protein